MGVGTVRSRVARVALFEVLIIADVGARVVMMLRGCLLSPRVAYVGLALLGLASLAVLFAVDPRYPGSYPICPFLRLTGCYCPGCGTLRALHSLLYGDLAAAFGYNPLAILSLPFVTYSFATGMLRAFQVPVPRPVYLPFAFDMDPAGCSRYILGAQERTRRPAGCAGPLASG